MDEFLSWQADIVNEYRRHLAGVLTKRAVLELEQRKMQEEK